MFLRVSPISDIHNRLRLILHKFASRLRLRQIFTSHVHVVVASLFILRSRGPLLTLLRQHVHAAERTVSQTSGDIRRDASRWLDFSLRPPRRQSEKLLIDISDRRAVLLVPRIMHVHRLIVPDLLLVLEVLRHSLLIEKVPTIVVQLIILAGIAYLLRIGLFLICDRLLLIFGIRSQIRRLRILQNILIPLLRFLPIIWFRRSDVRRW